MDKYVCLICGWIYDPAKGDPAGDIKPGIPFEDSGCELLKNVIGIYSK
jgi:rubredoxin